VGRIVCFDFYLVYALSSTLRIKRMVGNDENKKQRNPH
jgi:hypothetical protein